jgi:hypothetical protein
MMAVLAAWVAQASPAAAKTVHYYDFEKTTKPWTAGSNGPEFERSLTILNTENGCPSTSDTSHAFVKFLAEAGKPTGAWMVAAFPTVSNGADLVRMSYCQRTEDVCAGCTPVIYVGGEMPNSLSQFKPATPSISDQPVVAGWQTYQFPAPNEPDPRIYNKGTVYVAIGVAAPNFKANTVEGFGLDCVELTVFPAP